MMLVLPDEEVGSPITGRSGSRQHPGQKAAAHMEDGKIAGGPMGNDQFGDRRFGDNDRIRTG
jgi:hypothetical protein